MMSRLLAIGIAVCCAITFAQAPPPPQIANWQNQRANLRKQAQTALAAESARESTGDCPDANTTRAQEQCLTAEHTKTEANYAVFVQAIRSMLALAYPTPPGQKPISGPSGTPLTSDELLAEFDRLEAESKQYREHATKAAYDQYKGGTLAPVFSMEATQKLLRLHMHEIAFLYGNLLSNH